MAKKTSESCAEDILGDFAELPDPRSQVNRRHLLGDIIVISIMAVLAGADGPKAIYVWAKSHEDWLKDRLQLPSGVPSHDTIGRVLMMLKPAAFQSCFERWNKRVSGNRQEGELDIVAIDGKAVRRSHDCSAGLGPLFLVSAWAVKRGVSLGQLATEEKSNEITAIPELLEQIEIKGSVVTIDAAGCKKSIAAKIIDGKGDYVLALKGNQGTLYDAVINYIQKHMENDFADVTARHHVERVSGHGRKDEWIYYQLPVPEDLVGKEKWKNMRTLGVVIRMSERGKKWTSDIRYYISSLALGVKRFAECLRGHWGIENTLHWCLDVTSREDESRVRNRTLADSLAWLKRFAISLPTPVKNKHRDATPSGRLESKLTGASPWDSNNLVCVNPGLSGQENLTDVQRERFDAIYSQELETGKAWAYKEMLRDLWNHDNASSATVFFKDWYKRVIHTKLAPLKKVAKTIQERLTNVVSYCTHGITNSVAEGINSKIMSIKRRVGGYRNRENFKTAIYFYCAALDLYPR